MNNKTSQKANRKNPDWSKDQERYILYADLMGFKERVRTTPHLELKKQLQNFKAKVLTEYEPLQKGGQLKMVQYSDSILIVDNNTTANGLNRMSKAAAKLMHIALSEGFPLKAVLAKGMLTFDEDNELYFGQPLIDAFLLHEELHFYGIVAHHSIEKDIQEYSNGFTNTKKDVHNPYIHSCIPIKGGKTSHFHLAYNLIDQKLECGKDFTAQCHSCLDKIEKTVSGKPRIYIDNTRKVLNDDKKLLEEAIKTSVSAEKDTAVTTGLSKANTERQKTTPIFPIRATL